ncbi:MAG: NUDIX hydrolase [Syntrophobacteraceae bacterium]
MMKSKVNQIREIYRGRAWSFAVEDVTLPNGNRSDYAVVRHPGSTGIVPLLDDGTVLMTLQYRHVIGRYILEIPSGTMEEGESPLRCAERELEEETGYRAKELVEIAAVHIMPAYSDELIHLYLARGLTPASQALDPDEIIQVMNHPLEELLRFIEEGKITDGLTILALYRARAYLDHPHP